MDPFYLINFFWISPFLHNRQSEKKKDSSNHPKQAYLNLGKLTETTDGGSRGGSSGSRNGPGSSSNGLAAGPAFPDTDGLALDGVLSAEGAGVAGVLRDFHLLDLFTERGTVSDTVFTGHSDLLCALRHLVVV